MKNRTILACALFSLTAVLHSSPAAARPMASLLGLGREDRVLIIHADDLGMISAENRASLELMKGSLVRSGSVMMPCPALKEVLEAKARLPELDLGVHVTLNSEWKNYRWGPSSDPSLVPGLTNSQGNLARDLFSLYAFGQTGEVEREIRSQIEQALKAGLAPSHLDSHMGAVFMKEGWLRAYLNLAREYRLAPMIPRWSPELKASFGMLGRLLEYSPLARLSERIESRGYLMLDQIYLETRGRTYDERKQHYLKILGELKPGVSQIILHAAEEDGEFTEKVLSSNPAEKVRQVDARIFRDPEVRQFISARKIRLISWKEIQEIYPWGDVAELD